MLLWVRAAWTNGAEQQVRQFIAELNDEHTDPLVALDVYYNQMEALRQRTTDGWDAGGLLHIRIYYLHWSWCILLRYVKSFGPFIVDRMDLLREWLATTIGR